MPSATARAASGRYADELARLLSDIRADALPGYVRDKARLCLIDFLACAFEAQDRAWCRQAVEVAAGNSGRLECGRSSLIGLAGRVSLSDAVFANAVLGHGLVRDDMHLGSVSHLGATIVPVALGLAQLNANDGPTLIAAIVAGYEAGGRIGREILDVDVSRIHRPTGITGPFAAAATAAHLAGLDMARTAAALSLAANTTGGFNQWAATGGSEMYFHAGLAARNGLTAAQLAAGGAYVSPDAIDGPAGLLAAFGRQPRPPAEGAAYEISSVFFKQVPACNFAQSSAQAAAAIARTQRPRADDIEAVTVRVPYASAHYPGCDAPGPFEHELQAKMSIHYNVAAALVTGNFAAANFDPARHAGITALAGRVTLEVDDALTRAFPARQGAEVIVHTRAGERLSRRVDDVAPAPDDEVRRRLQAAAAPIVGAAAADGILACIDGLESCSNAGDLLALTVPGGVN